MVSSVMFSVFAFAVSLSAPAGDTEKSGWVLVTPPVRWTGTKYEVLQAPTTEWRYRSAHDTASSCEEERRKVSNQAVSALEKSQEGTQSWRGALEILETFGRGRCVPYHLWWGKGK